MTRLRPWMFVSAAWIGPAILGGIDVVMRRYLHGDPPASAAEVLFVSLDWLLYALLTPGVFVVARRWPLARPRLGGHIALHAAMSLAFCAAWAGAGTILRALLMPEALRGQAALSLLTWLFITLPFGVAVYFAVVGIEHATRYLADAREREMQVTRLSGQLATARLAALQAQLNPHFLFNSLNTINVLVRDGDARTATRVIEQLSDVLRRTLGRPHANEVRLADELELVRQYVAVEEARFSDRLQTEFAIEPSTLSGAVPAFALQHLVENAIRHGIARRTDAGRVAVSARRAGDTLELSVEDDGAGIGAGADRREGHGLENTRERLRTLYGERASLDVAAIRQGTIARMRIPYREVADE